MQLEITLLAEPGAGYVAGDLGYLLHKNPARLHHRDLAAGPLSIFYSEVSDRRATAVIHQQVDPVGPVSYTHLTLPTKIV